MNFLFDPQCSVPLFQQTDFSVVDVCSRKTGYIIAIGLTMIYIFFYLIPTLATLYHDKKINFKEKLIQLTYTMMWFIGVQIFLWILIPGITSYMGSYSWKGYQAQLDQLEKQGFSRTDAMVQIQSYQESKLQANATERAGLNISNALKSRRS